MPRKCWRWGYSHPDIEQLIRNDFVALLADAIDTAAINGSGSSNQPTGILQTSGIGSVAASRGTTALPAAFSQVICLSWFKRRECKVDKRVLLETEGREEDLQLLVLQHAAQWTLEGDAAEQLEALFKQETENKLSDAQADVLELCRERWKEFKRTSRRDVVQHCDAYKDKDRKALRHLRSLEGNGLLESKAETTENGTEISFKPTE